MKQNKSLMSSRILIVGLARNCAKSIRREISVISNAFECAKSVDWLIIESDSDDDTLAELNAISREFNLSVCSLGQLRGSYSKRTQRIAVCRNRYVSEINNNPEYSNIDYVVVADLDGINLKLNSLAVQSCWETDVAWDACFANQSAPYYDVWALRHDYLSPNDCYLQERYLQSLGFDEYWCRHVSVFSRMAIIPDNTKPIKVKSAFGGLGIYKKYLFGRNSYIGINDKGYEICEHVPFHLSLGDDANLYIMPSLINGGWNEHSKYCKLIYRVTIYVVNYFVSFQNLRKARCFIWRLAKE